MLDLTFDISIQLMQRHLIRRRKLNILQCVTSYAAGTHYPGRQLLKLVCCYYVTQSLKPPSLSSKMTSLFLHRLKSVGYFLCNELITLPSLLFSSNDDRAKEAIHANCIMLRHVGSMPDTAEEILKLINSHLISSTISFSLQITGRHVQTMTISLNRSGLPPAATTPPWTTKSSGVLVKNGFLSNDVIYFNIFCQRATARKVCSLRAANPGQFRKILCTPEHPLESSHGSRQNRAGKRTSFREDTLGHQQLTHRKHKKGT